MDYNQTNWAQPRPAPGGAPQNDWGGSESQIAVRFYKDMRPQPAASQAEGRPVFVAVDMVEIRVAGERDTTRDFVNALHKARWPRAWAQYQANEQQTSSGTPLELLFSNLPDVASTLRSHNIMTVEALANVPDSIANIPFLTEYRERARKYVERAASTDTMRDQLAKSEDTIKELMGRLAALENQAPKRGPGRPPNAPPTSAAA